MKWFYSIIFAILLTIALVNAQDQQYRQNGNLHTILESRYWNGTASVPVNTTIKTSSGLYGYQMTNANFKIYFRNNSNTAGAVRFEKKGYFFTYDVSGSEVLWRSRAGQPDVWATLGGSVSSNSQDTQIITNGVNAVYPIAFSNTNLTYSISNGMLKENLVLTGLPSVKDYLYLEFGGKIEFNKSLQICTETQCYIPSGAQDDFSTSGRIYFKNMVNETIFYIDTPIIKDKLNRTIVGNYRVRGSDAQMFYYLRINTTFISRAFNESAFPLYIDPTIITLDEFNVTMIISPENETCAGLECHSDISFINSGTNNITINTSDVGVQIDGSQSSRLTFWDEVAQSDLSASDGYNITLLPNQTFQIDIMSNQMDYGTFKYNVTLRYNNYTYKIDPFYISVSSPGQQTTQDAVNTVVVSTLNLTIEPYNLLYAILWSSETGSATGTASSYYDLLIDGTNYSSQLIEAKDTLATGFYVSTGALWVGNFTQGTYPISTRFRAALAATNTRIRNNVITALELPYESNYLQSRAAVNFEATNARLQGTNINVVKTQPYWVFGSSIVDNDGTVNTQLRIDDVAYSNSTWAPKDVRDFVAFTGQDVINLTAGVHNMSIWGSSSVAGAEMRDFNLVAVPLDTMYYFYNDSDGVSSTTSGATKLRLDFTLNSSTNGSWLIVAAAQTAESVNTASVVVNMTVDGVGKCEVIREPQTTGGYPILCQSSEYLAAGNHSIILSYSTTVPTTTTASIRQASIIAFYSTADKPCNPRYNRDWVISNAQVCDNVERTIGVGRLNITSTGSLDMRNGANITGTRVPPFLHNVTAPWKFLLQRLSRLTLTREYWRNTNYQKRTQISITNVGTTSLIDFPVYLNIVKEPTMLANYSDLRFYSGRCDSPVETVLSYEVENYTSTNAYVWVKVPFLVTGQKQICMYYDNPNAIYGQDPDGVWTANYTMVQHFEETSGTILDSTNKNNDGTNNGSTYGVSGIIGTANSFDGGTARITLPFASSIDLSRLPAWQIEAWVNTTVLAGTQFPTVFAQGQWRAGLSLTDQTAGTDGRIESWINDVGAAQGTTATTNGVWSYVVLSMDTSGRYFYFNGNPDGTAAYANPNDANEDFAIGNVFASRADAGLNGIIDELRISNVRRSTDWINQTYQLIANQNSFVSYGSVETQASIK